MMEGGVQCLGYDVFALSITNFEVERDIVKYGATYKVCTPGGYEGTKN